MLYQKAVAPTLGTPPPPPPPPPPLLRAERERAGRSPMLATCVVGGLFPAPPSDGYMLGPPPRTPLVFTYVLPYTASPRRLKRNSYERTHTDTHTHTRTHTDTHAHTHRHTDTHVRTEHSVVKLSQVAASNGTALSEHVYTHTHAHRHTRAHSQTDRHTHTHTHVRTHRALCCQVEAKSPPHTHTTCQVDTTHKSVSQPAIALHYTTLHYKHNLFAAD